MQSDEVDEPTAAMPETGTSAVRMIRLMSMLIAFREYVSGIAQHKHSKSNPLKDFLEEGGN